MDKITFTLPAFGAAIAGQGGYFVGIMRGAIVDGVEQAPYALLVSDAVIGEASRSTWGPRGVEVSGANSHSDGLANTDAMAAANCASALYVRCVTSTEGKSDYYLPALGELNMAKANVPELFSTHDYYWSSTQGSSYYAFVQDFEDGFSDWFGKGGERRVRAFRRIPLQLLSTSPLQPA